jgi:uncharacterized iron-regulated protein
MKRGFSIPAIVLLAACAGGSPTPPSPGGLNLPAGVTVISGTDGSPVEANELLGRLAAADIVLLGELHDNAVHHAVRGQLIAISRARRPAIVFEQFAETSAPIAMPADANASEAWLDQNGFDRQAWRWPLHKPVVDAAIAYGASLWGSGISREALRAVVREGEGAAPAHLRSLLEQALLDDAARTALDRELQIGHCGQLPENMVSGMRAAQTVRDAAMTRTLLRAREGAGSAWLIAGNGHVRRDIAVPRMLSVAAANLSVLVVGFVEAPASGGQLDPSERSLYDVAIVTPRAERPDPCAGLRIRG